MQINIINSYSVIGSLLFAFLGANTGLGMEEAHGLKYQALEDRCAEIKKSHDDALELSKTVVIFRDPNYYVHGHSVQTQGRPIPANQCEKCNLKIRMAQRLALQIAEEVKQNCQFSSLASKELEATNTFLVLENADQSKKIQELESKIRELEAENMTLYELTSKVKPSDAKPKVVHYHFEDEEL